MPKISFKIKIHPWNYVNRKASFFISPPMSSEFHIVKSMSEFNIFEHAKYIGDNIYYIEVNHPHEFTLDYEIDIPDECKIDHLSGSPEVENAFISPSPIIINLANSLKRQARSEVEMAKLAFDYVAGQMNYIYPPKLYGAANVAESLEGDCLCYSQLFSSLCIAMDIPTRTVFGWLVGLNFDSPHVWNQVHIDDNWISIDTTLAQLSTEFESTFSTRLDRDSYFGHSTPHHLILSYGHMNQSGISNSVKSNLNIPTIGFPDGVFKYGAELIYNRIPWIQGVYPLIDHCVIGLEYYEPFSIEASWIP